MNVKIKSSQKVKWEHWDEKTKWDLAPSNLGLIDYKKDLEFFKNFLSFGDSE